MDRRQSVQSTETAEKRGIVALVDGTNLLSWQDELIRRIRQIDDSHLAVCDLATGKSVSGKEQKADTSLLGALSSRFLDRKRFSRDAFAVADWSVLAKDFSIIGLQELAAGNDHQFTLAINLGPRIDEKGTADLLSMPVWGLRFGQGTDIDTPLAGSWEIVNGEPLTILLVVEARPDQEALQTIYEAASSTLTYSSRASAGQLAWKAVECVPRLLAKKEQQHLLSKQSWGTSSSKDITLLPVKENGGKKVSSLPFARWFTSRLVKKLKNKFFREQWVMLVGDNSSSFMPSNLKTILPPRDRIWADPFAIQRQEKMIVFFEDMPFSTWRGRISCAELHGDGSLGEVIPVLERDYHLSYPFLLELKDELYMIPESGENNGIELYRCSSFPGQWEYVGNLMNNVEAWDATIFQYNGYWWLFANMAPVQGISSWDQLHLFYAKEFPTDDWTPHPTNPIVDDARFSRPAGYIFFQGDKLIRPSQNSEGCYGRGLNFNEVIELTPDTYREVLLEKHFAENVSAKMSAMHTINRCGKLWLLDGQLFRRKKQDDSRSVAMRPL